MATRRSNGDGSVTKASDGRWTARIQIGKNPNGSPKIKAFYGKNKAEATKKMREYLLHTNPNDVDVSKEIFGDYLLRWFELYKSRSLKPTTYDRNDGIIRNQIIPAVGGFQIGNISVDHIQQFINQLQDEGYSHSTLNKAKQLLDGCFKYALTKQAVKFNPVVGIEMPSSELFEKKDIVILGEDDINRFVQMATSIYPSGAPVYRYGWGLVFILYTGLRLGEALGVKWSDIDYAEKLIKVKSNVVVIKNRNKTKETEPNFIVNISSTKTKKGTRDVYLSHTALQALSELKNIVSPAKENSYIFATSTGKIAGKRNMYRAVESIAERAELSIEHCNVHALRHTFASMLFRKGVDIKTISALLGHSKVEFTYNTYVHLIEEQKHSAVSLLDTL